MMAHPESPAVAAWREACRDYRAAYDAHQNAPAGQFARTIPAWNAAADRLKEAERAMMESAR